MNNHKNIEMYIFSCALFLSGCTKEIPVQLYEQTTEKPFLDVIQDAEFAITEHNFRITNRLHIGEAIQKRGSTDFPQNEVILFCNLTLAEDMLRIEPRYINYCPYKITITELNDQVIVGTRLLPTQHMNAEMDKIAKEINKTLSAMVEYAAADDLFMFDDIQEAN